MSISQEDKRAIDEAMKSLHYIETDKNGCKFTEIYADYRDTNESLLQPAYSNRNAASPLPGDYEPENALLYTLQDEISSWYDHAIYEMEDEVLRSAGFDLSDDMAEEKREYLRENYYFAPPFDHFLDQDMQINIMLDCNNEVNRDFVAIHEQYQALIGNLDPEDTDLTLADETSLRWLVEQQGYTMDDLQETMQEYADFFYDQDGPPKECLDQDGKMLPLSQRIDIFNKTHSVFLTSVCQELENMINYMNAMTILAKVSMKDFCELTKPGKEITFSKDTMLGIFSPWQGGGSVLEIELEKDLVVPADKIWDIQVEGAKMVGQYSLDSTYGLVGSAWKEPLSIKDAPAPVKEGASLDSMIESAEAKKTPAHDQHNVPEPERD